MEPRNVIRSKRLIKKAVMKLILKKNPADIKVTEITNLADINRGTFYAHYSTIFDVISEIEDDLINDFLHNLKSSRNIPFCQLTDSSQRLHAINFSFIEEMLQHGYKHQKLILKHYNRNLFPNLTLKFKEKIYNHILQHSEISSSEQVQLDYKIIISFMVSGYVGLVTDWAAGSLGTEVTPEIIFPYIKSMILKLSDTSS